MASKIKCPDCGTLSSRHELLTPPGCKQCYKNKRKKQKQKKKSKSKIVDEKKEDIKEIKKKFIESSTTKKNNIAQLPSLSKINEDQKEAEELTNKIFSESKDNYNLSDRNTLLNVLGNISKENGGNCLFFDSKTTNLASEQNAEKELKFTLNLNGFDDDNDDKENEVDKVMKLKSCIESKKDHPIITDFQERLSKVYNVDPKQIKIVDIFCGTINVTYVVDVDKDKIEEYYKENIAGEADDIVNKIKKQFKEYKDCKMHAILFRQSFDINMFDEGGNKTFDSGDTFQVGPKGRQQKYTQPTKWIRYGLNVLDGKKYGNDHTWLHPFQHENNWYRVYHGTGSSNDTKGKSVDVMAWIQSGGFHFAGAQMYGPGVYCSPDPAWLENSYAGTHYLNGKTYKFMLQCGVNPDGVRIYQDKHCGGNWKGGKPYGPIWVANTPNDIRAYAILIKEC